MKFRIINYGDPSVGINGFETTAVIPNIGYDEKEWREWCESFLHEMYSSETKSIIMTEEDYQIYLKQLEELEKEEELENDTEDFENEIKTT